MSYSNYVNIHGYCSSWKYSHIFTLTNVGVFCSKCVKCVLFSILEDYRWADVVAPRALASMQKFPSIL